MKIATAQAIDNQSPGNLIHKVGTNLRMALEIRGARQQEFVRYVDSRVASSGDGRSWEGAFKTISEGISAINAVGLSGKGATLLIAPGSYIEVAASVPDLSSYDNLITGIGLPEDTLWYGSGTAGSISAATDDLLNITGGNNLIMNITPFVNKNTKAAIVFNDTGAGYHGSFNMLKNVYFSPQTQDGEKYCIRFDGGNVNIIEDCFLYGALTAGILLTGNVGDPIRNIIRNNHIVGTAIGIHITSANYNTLIKDNWFDSGSETDEDMTNAIVITAGMDAGKVTIIKNTFEQAIGAAITDASGGTAVVRTGDNNNLT